MDIVVSTKTVCCFSNNKPWITSNVKDLLNKKKRAFKEGDQAELKHVQKLQENNMREVWDDMKTITGCKKSSSTVEGDVVRANQFNHFYNRFENPAPVVNACPTPIPVPHPPAAAICSPHATTPTPPPPDPPLPLLRPLSVWPHSLQIPAFCHLVMLCSGMAICMSHDCGDQSEDMEVH